MQLLIKHQIADKLVLPLSYHHILQAIIYKNLNPSYGYSSYLHNNGYAYGERSFKLFTFSLLQGKYEVQQKNIIFRQEVSFEVRSPALFMIKMLADNIMKNGIYYGSQHFSEVDVYLSDTTVESENIHIKMRSPISVYSTVPGTKETYFYSPDDEEFPQMVSDNFIRKYMACYGVPPQNGIWLKPAKVNSKNKYVTKYKNFYISGWMGEYYLNGERKYLDFLYQTGLGGKNSQGFGMFDII